MEDKCAPRILSIQSSVCSGYVGNRAATFPLQLLGYDVSCINTVQFSTHTGYPTIKGQKLAGEEMTTLYDGLVANQVGGFVGLLTGYVPGTEGVQAISKIASIMQGIPTGDVQQQLIEEEDTLRQQSTTETKLIWVLDPVMGDEDRGLYVSSDIPSLYRDMIGKASIITPNSFELGLLAERSIDSLQDVLEACRVLHASVEKIVVTTVRLGKEIAIVGSVRDGETFQVVVPYFNRPYQGTGDLFAALLLAYTLRGLSLKEAVLKVLDTMKPILERTGRVFDARVQGDWPAQRRLGQGAKICQSCELRIIESAKDILDPQTCYIAATIGSII